MAAAAPNVAFALPTGMAGLCSRGDRTVVRAVIASDHRIDRGPAFLVRIPGLLERVDPTAAAALNPFLPG